LVLRWTLLQLKLDIAMTQASDRRAAAIIAYMGRLFSVSGSTGKSARDRRPVTIAPTSLSFRIK